MICKLDCIQLMLLYQAHNIALKPVMASLQELKKVLTDGFKEPNSKSKYRKVPGSQFLLGLTHFELPTGFGASSRDPGAGTPDQKRRTLKGYRSTHVRGSLKSGFERSTGTKHKRGASGAASPGSLSSCPGV